MLSAVLDVVKLLSAGSYEEVERHTRGVRLSAAELAAAVAEYGGSLVTPPPETAGRLSVVRVTTPNPTWSVYVPLATAEERWSDLTLQLTASQKPDGTTVIEVDDLHVL